MQAVNKIATGDTHKCLSHMWRKDWKMLALAAGSERAYPMPCTELKRRQ